MFTAFFRFFYLPEVSRNQIFFHFFKYKPLKLMHEIKKNIAKILKKDLLDIHTRKIRVQKQQSNRIQNISKKKILSIPGLSGGWLPSMSLF